MRCRILPLDCGTTADAAEAQGSSRSANAARVRCHLGHRAAHSCLHRAEVNRRRVKKMRLIFRLLHVQNSARAILLRIDEYQRSMVDLSGASLLSWRVGKYTRWREVKHSQRPLRVARMIPHVPISGRERELSAKCHRSSISRSMTPATAREAMNCQLAFEKISADAIGTVDRDG